MCVTTAPTREDIYLYHVEMKADKLQVHPNRLWVKHVHTQNTHTSDAPSSIVESCCSNSVLIDEDRGATEQLGSQSAASALL